MPDPSPAPLTPEEDARLPKSLDPVLAGFRVFTNDRCCSLAEERQCEAEALALERDILALVDELAALREENERLRVQVRAQAAALDKGVQHVCDSMRTWRNAMDAEDKDVRGIDDVFRMISKSSMLDRLIYGCEPLRTEKCPTHKGRWSGLSSSPNECPHGCNLTGWLPAKPPAPAQEAREG